MSLVMNNDLKNHISLWLPAPPMVTHTAGQRRLRARLPLGSVLTQLPQQWQAPHVTKLDPQTPTPRLAA